MCFKKKTPEKRRKKMCKAAPCDGSAPSGHGSCPAAPLLIQPSTHGLSKAAGGGPWPQPGRVATWAVSQ